MRPYPADSPEAMARLVTIALVADDSVSRDEVDQLDRDEVLMQIGIDRCHFDAIYCEVHEDMLAHGTRLPDGRLVLDARTIEDLLDDICSPALQLLMVRTIQAIGHADRIMTGGETALLGMAMRRWNVDLFEPGHAGIPMRRPRQGRHVWSPRVALAGPTP
jgi:hypothetical protein